MNMRALPMRLYGLLVTCRIAIVIDFNTYRGALGDQLYTGGWHRILVGRYCNVWEAYMTGSVTEAWCHDE